MPCITSLLLDRDGTVIVDKHYLCDPAGVELLPGVAEGLAWCVQHGMRLFIVSNQSGIGRGMFSSGDADAVNTRMASMLAPYGVEFTAMLYCPHAPEDACICRKPGTGMWDQLVQQYKLDPSQCMMIGDKQDDMRFAAAAGLKLRGLVLTGKGTVTAKGLGLIDDDGIQTGTTTPLPQSPAHPNILLSSFIDLPEALARLEETDKAKAGPCSV